MKPSEKKIDVSTPYGLQAVVEASEKIAAEHIISDITALIARLEYLGDGALWQRFVSHTGWIDPSDRIGVLDFHYEFGADLSELKIELIVYQIVGGNGLPLFLSGDQLATAWLSLDPREWGTLKVFQGMGANPSWAEWMAEAREVFRTLWLTELSTNGMARLTNELTHEAELTRLIKKLWAAENVSHISTNLGLELVAVDDEEEAPEHCSQLEFAGQQVHLVTPWLAAELEKRGAIAGTQMGLSLWARDNLDAPHLEHVLQDIAYEKLGQTTMSSELSKATKE